MSSAVEGVLIRLRKWRREFSPNYAVDKVYLFGSVVYRGGARFNPEQDSDVDLLMCFSDGPNAVKRADAQRELVEHVGRLEKSLREVLPGESNTPIISVALMTAPEFHQNVHFVDKPGFWESTRFVDLLNPEGQQEQLFRYSAETFKSRFRYAVVVLRDAQRARNEYLTISSNGTRPIVPQHTDNILKKMWRSAASLKYFIERGDKEIMADPNVGLKFLLHTLENARADPAIGRVWDRISGLSGRGPRVPPTPDEQLLVWEVLADKALEAIGHEQRAASNAPVWRPQLTSTSVATYAEADPEETFLTLASGPSLRLGALDLACKLFPESQMSRSNSPEVFEDDQEAERRLELVMTEQRLPENLLDKLVQEIRDRREEIDQLDEEALAVVLQERQSLDDTLGRLTGEGSNAYPRLVATPAIQETTEAGKPSRIMRVYIGPSRYGIALVEERRLRLPTALGLRSRYILNSLAVRIAYIVKESDGWWIEFHQRHPKHNATYPGAWDIGAAGYLDQQSHRDPIDNSRISPWQAAAHEIAEELGIGFHQLPHRDKFYFFGVGRNDPTGQLDLLGYCEGLVVPPVNRPISYKVKKYGRCRLTPESVAMFILDGQYWVPTALLTAILILRHFKFTHDEIEAAFSKLVGKISQAP